MSKAAVEWGYRGQYKSSAEIIADLRESYEEQINLFLNTIEEELQNFINRMNQQSTMRGIGRYSNAYNRPLQNARVKRTVSGNRIVITVPDDTRSGYVFNILDYGIPTRRKISAGFFKFPRYQGHKTKTEGDTLSVNREPVYIVPNSWVSTRFVRGAEPRNFYESAVKRAKRRIRYLQTKKNRFVGVKFDFDSIDVRVVRR